MEANPAIKIDCMDIESQVSYPNNFVKEELTADQLELYAGHVIKEEMVIGPEVLQKTEIVETNAGISLCQEVNSDNQYNNDDCLTKQSSCKTNSHSNPKSRFDLKIKQKERQNSNTKDNLKMSIKVFVCDFCDKTFNGKETLKEHLKTCVKKKPYICSVCSKSFNTKSNLSSHVNIHTGEKPHVCDVCGKSFRLKGSLKQHLKVHTGLKPYVCDVCDKRFGRKSNLGTHLQVHTRGRPYTCDVCLKCFSQKSTLKLHLTSHTGQNLLDSVCSNSSSVKNDLKSYWMIHTGENPYMCDILTYPDGSPIQDTFPCLAQSIASCRLLRDRANLARQHLSSGTLTPKPVVIRRVLLYKRDK